MDMSWPTAWFGMVAVIAIALMLSSAVWADAWEKRGRRYDDDEEE